jgi:hypothetical protein
MIMIAFPNPSASNTGLQVFPADTLLVMWARRSQSLPLYISGTSSNPTVHSSAAIMPLITTSAHRHEHIGISMLVFRTCRSAQTLIEVKSIYTVAPILPDAIVMQFLHRHVRRAGSEKRVEYKHFQAPVFVHRRAFVVE